MEGGGDAPSLQEGDQRRPLFQIGTLNVEHMAVMDAPFRNHRQVDLPCLLQRFQSLIVPIPTVQAASLILSASSS